MRAFKLHESYGEVLRALTERRYMQWHCLKWAEPEEALYSRLHFGCAA